MRPTAAVPHILTGFDLVIGFDTEFVKSQRQPANENLLLTYQLHVMCPATGASTSQWFRPNGALRAQRRTMPEVLMNAVVMAEKSGIYTRPPNAASIRIAFVGHFSRADLPGFADFKKWKRKVSAIRGTFASVTRPMFTDIRFHGGGRLKGSVTLFDTLLLAAAGAQSLAALGDALGVKKLSVPDVIDETGKTVPAITRMDLAFVQYRREYITYALRDAEIAVQWLVVVARLAERFGLKRMYPTIASMAVDTFVNMHPAAILGPTLGYEISQPKSTKAVPKLKREMVSKMDGVLSLLANSYHGGRNEAFLCGEAHGSVARPLRDIDLTGAYTTALAFFRPLDWGGMRHTEDLDLLATCEVPTVAQVRFSFPEHVRYPSLPVDGYERGLLYPRSGQTTVTGSELVVARIQGAEIKIEHGLRIEWLDPDGVRPFVDYTRLINVIRSEHPKGHPIEKLAKEAGNSLYGRLGQAVGRMKSKPNNRTVFDTATGKHRPLEPCKITSPLLASYASGLPRAVLSEILARMPDHVQVVSVTTDGILSDASEAEVAYALDGPVARHFRALRRLVDAKGSDQIIEVKHEALSVLSVRTRGAFTLVPHNGSDLIVTRCGHKVDTTFTDKRAEADYWVNLVRTRVFDQKILGWVFRSVADQWHADGDLTDEPRWVRVAFDYDFKRIAVDPQDRNGLIAFDTRPWSDLASFEAFRDSLGRWRNKSQSIIKTADDLARFTASMASPSFANKGAAVRTPFQNAILAAWASGTHGFTIRTGRGQPSGGVSAPTYEDVAKVLTEAGVPEVTRDVLKHARARKAHQKIEPAPLYEIDMPVLAVLLEKFPPEVFAHFLDEEALKRFSAWVEAGR